MVSGKGVIKRLKSESFEDYRKRVASEPLCGCDQASTATTYLGANVTVCNDCGRQVL